MNENRMNDMFQKPATKTANTEGSNQGFHPSLQVETEKNERGFVDYYIKTPFELKDALKAEYEARKARGEKVFRMWNPDRKKFKCNKLWAQVVSDMVSGKTQTPSVPKSKNPQTVYSDLYDLATAAIDCATAAGDPQRIEAFTQAKNWIQSVRGVL